jgi:protein-disulfide isomerase
MALPPKFAALRLAFADPAPSPATSVPPAVHTIEVYLDYTCPYANRTFQTITTAVIPAVRADPVLASALQVIFRQLVQPWHRASAPAHEAALAVLRVAPERFWIFSAALFGAQAEFFDGRVAAEPSLQTYQRLAHVASSVGVDGNTVLDMLKVPEAPGHHAGNVGTKELKEIIKMARLAGVHFTPTVVFDGVVQSHISSDWTAEKWIVWLRSVVQVADT